MQEARYFKVEDGELYPLPGQTPQRGRRHRRRRDPARQVKRTLLLVAKVAVSLALLAYLFTTTDLAALVARVRTGDTLLLALAVLLYLAMLALSTWRWRLLLQRPGLPGARCAGSLRRTWWRASSTTSCPSNIGGDVIRVRDSSRLTGSTTTTSLAVVAIDRILGFGALYVLAARGLRAREAPRAPSRGGPRRAARPLPAVLGAWPTCSSARAAPPASWP